MVMEQISSKVRDNGIKTAVSKPTTGGRLLCGWVFA